MSKKHPLAVRFAPIIPNGFSLPIPLKQALRDRARLPRKVPDLPFFRDPTHTLPTLRLYRHLLRLTAPRPSIVSDGAIPSSAGALAHRLAREGLKRDWRAHRAHTSIPTVRTYLSSQLELRSRLLSSLPDEVEAAVRELGRIEKRGLKSDRRLARRNTPPPQPRPRLTGGFMRPTLLNGPLPRLKPQPLKISMMMKSRLRARENRQAKQKILQEWSKNMKHEMAFYREVYASSPPLTASPDGSAEPSTNSTTWGQIGSPAIPAVGEGRKAREIRQVKVTGVDSSFMGGWDEEFDRTWSIFQEQYGREVKRMQSKFPEELVEKVMAARKRRDAAMRQRAERRKRRAARELEAAAVVAAAPVSDESAAPASKNVS